MNTAKQVPIIDAHHHLWDLRRAYYPLLHGTKDRFPSRNTEGNYLPADYRRDVAGHNVVGSVHVEAAHDPDEPIAETRWLHEQAVTTGVPSALVAYADLRAHDVEHVLDGHLGYPTVRGVRQMLDVNPRGDGTLHDALEDDAWMSGLRAVADRGLCFVAQVETAALDRLVRVLREVPDLPVVLCHAGLRGSDALDDWMRWTGGLEQLAERGNAVVAVSGVAGLVPTWDQALAVRVTRTVLDVVGPDRAMFGSNFPVDRDRVSFGQLLAAAMGASAHLGESGRREFFAGTARRVYRLPA